MLLNPYRFGGGGEGGGSPSFVASTTGFSAVDGSTSVTRPLYAEGDVLLCYMVMSSGVAVTVPSGWTMVTNSVSGTRRVVLASKVATASEPATYSFTTTTTAARHWWCATYRGVSTVTAGTPGYSSSGTSTVAPAIVMPAGGILVASLCKVSGGINQTVTSHPSGLDSRITLTSTAYCMAAYDALGQPAGDTGSRTVAWSGTGAGFAQLIGLT